MIPSRSSALRLSALLAVFILSCTLANAQGLGQLTGTITDPTGAAVGGAKVTATQVGTGVARTVETTAEGFYTIPSLHPATYDIAVDAAGFRPVSSKGVGLQADQSLTVSFKLEVGSVNETLNVSGTVAQVDTSTATLSEVVDQRRIVDIPLNGRNAAALMLVSAGTVLGPPQGADEGNTKTFPVSMSVSANGARQNQTAYRLDGSNNNDLYTNTNQPFPFPDALQEISVQTSNYSSKYGGNAGGVVNIVTKSGVNDVHGDMFDFLRNGHLNARNFFALTRDTYHRNQFGGTIGGPVFVPGVYNGKNKTFFFAGYQGTRIRNSASPSTTTLTAAEESGNFTADGKNLTDPRNGGVAFPGMQIPVTQFDKSAVALEKYLPSGIGGNGSVTYQTPTVQNFDEVLAKIDHSFSEKDRLSGRYFFDRYTQGAFLDIANYFNNLPSAVIVSHNFMLNETHTFGPSVLNDFRVSVARETSHRSSAPNSINVNDLGVNMWQPPVEKILEGINITGKFNIAQSDPARFVRDQYTIGDSVYWTKGAHSLNFGVDANRAWVLIRNQFYQPGQWGFTGTATGFGAADFLLGTPDTFRQGNGEAKDNRVNTFGLYIQDDWKVSRKLTINIGLRYDPSFPWKETKGRVSVFYPDLYAAGKSSPQYTNATAVPGLFFPGDPGVPQYGNKTNYKNFGPRLGMAYDLTGDGKTSIRSGIGMFYDSSQNGIYNNRFVDTSPFSLQVQDTKYLGYSFSNPYLNRPGGSPFPAPYPPPQNIKFITPAIQGSYDVGHGGVYQTPVTYAWNFTLERQLTADWLLRVAYVGSHASHLLETVQLSPQVPSTGNPLMSQYSDLFMAAQDVNSSYHSLQATIKKNFSKGLQAQLNYTWSRSMDDLPATNSITTVNDTGFSPMSYYSPGRHNFDYGPSEFDHKHRLVGSFVWELPKLAGSAAIVRHVVGGWQLSGLFSAQSGGPFTIVSGQNTSGYNLLSSPDRATQIVANPYGAGACGTTLRCVDFINPAAFAPVVKYALGTPSTWYNVGNTGKDAFRGPDMITYDGRLSKNFAITKERVRLQLEAEFFNLFNRVNLYTPGVTADASRNAAANPNNNTSQGNSNFGGIKTAFDPRIGQVALKLVF